METKLNQEEEAKKLTKEEELVATKDKDQDSEEDEDPTPATTDPVPLDGLTPVSL